MLLDRIKLFVTVAKHNNLAKTAQEIHVSASSICQRLKLLESDFGVKLYRRNKHGIELTGAGRNLLTTANDVLSRLTSLQNDFNDNHQPVIRSLRVGGTYNPSARYLPSAIAAFQRIHPEVNVNFLTGTKAEIEKFVQERQLDIAIVQRPSKSRELYTEHFAVDSLTLFAHPTHPLSKKKRLRLKDLAATSLIIRDGRGTTEKMLKELESRGVTLNITLRCGSPDAVKAAVRRKMGVGILFYNHIDDDVKGNAFKVLKFSDLTSMVGSSYIVYNKKEPLSSPAAEFLTVLRSLKPRQPKQNSAIKEDPNPTKLTAQNGE